MQTQVVGGTVMQSKCYCANQSHRSFGSENLDDAASAINDFNFKKLDKDYSNLNKWARKKYKKELKNQKNCCWGIHT
ncbi:hypothetical protein GLYMA_11G195600v4 [Glycine max]|uniref:Uncharacterized protein n=2 Tax=Glycine subgen. Soja TaxID=1462606 RepID=A0A0R0HJF5_SOYBN|nr:hypothetical protein JHK85_031965 [Glycine max]RZB80444.1 hypothetical protein D0Y65_030244 [Glycine soja]KAG4994577.1 hypothetical protein JHK86_031404 [Glycine max]KAG5146001.1 hypothetical protein JHK84_031544 [Glycine max]KAH1159414.1 hypothetical protein GYH30_031227 [Glycine max]